MPGEREIGGWGDGGKPRPSVQEKFWPKREPKTIASLCDTKIVSQRDAVLNFQHSILDFSCAEGRGFLFLRIYSLRLRAPA